MSIACGVACKQPTKTKSTNFRQCVCAICVLQGKEAGIRTLVALDDQGGKTCNAIICSFFVHLFFSLSTFLLDPARPVFFLRAAVFLLFHSLLSLSQSIRLQMKSKIQQKNCNFFILELTLNVVLR